MLSFVGLEEELHHQNNIIINQDLGVLVYNTPGILYIKNVKKIKHPYVDVDRIFSS